MPLLPLLVLALPLPVLSGGVCSGVVLSNSGSPPDHRNAEPFGASSATKRVSFLVRLQQTAAVGSIAHSHRNLMILGCNLPAEIHAAIDVENEDTEVSLSSR
jgi:hypothetical protein